MLFKKQKFDWTMVGLLALGLFLYVSYQPRFRLIFAMPADFVDEPLAGPSQKPHPEAKIASAYWSCLANNIQWQYGYGHTLPSDPPPDFTTSIHPAQPRGHRHPNSLLAQSAAHLVSADRMAETIRVEFQLDHGLGSERWRSHAPSVRTTGQLATAGGIATHHDLHWPQFTIQYKR